MRNKTVIRAVMLTVVGLGLCAVALPEALATSTRKFSLDSEEALSAGKLEGSAVHSDGSVTAGVQTRRLALDNVGVARSLLVRPDGTAYVGTGNDGTIHRVVGDKVSLFARTKTLLVTSLAMDKKGTLYAGTLPEGKILAIDPKGKVRTFAQPKGAKDIWDLTFDAKGKTLYAATGPEGKVFAVDQKGRAEVYYDSDAGHIMALARAADGTLYAGTSDEALLLRLTGPGRAEVVYDFEGNEVTAIAVRDGSVAVAANLFPKAPAAKKKTAKKKDDQDDSAPKSTPVKPPAPGKGQLYRIAADGRAERLFDSPKGHLTAVEWGEDGVIYVATGKGGRIHRIQPDGTHAVWIDVDEEQVQAIALRGPHPTFTTGDGGAVYRVESARAKGALWTSKVLDARFQARWGQLAVRGQGKLAFRTRSGNTEKPDDSWSEWSSELGGDGPIRSPAARFLQIRATLDPAPGSVLYAVDAYYLPRNQQTRVHTIAVAPKKAKSKGKGKGKAASSTRDSSEYKVSWKVDNQDGDELRYRLSFRREGGRSWRTMLDENEILTATSYTWQTDGVPDGHYRVRVEVSDELSNPMDRILRSHNLSEPVLVDNHPPHIVGLSRKGGAVVGRATDNLGPIRKLEYKVDTGEWQLLFPEDDLLDTRQERFKLPISELGKDPQLVSIRATDARGNTSTEQIELGP